MKTQKTNDAVGYKHPPKEHQFKPGLSGNYGGRPPNRKRDTNSSQDGPMTREGDRLVEFRQGDRVVTISMDEAIHRRIATEAVGGQGWAARRYSQLKKEEASQRHERAIAEFEEAYALKVTLKAKLYLAEERNEPEPTLPMHPDQILLLEGFGVKYLRSRAEVELRKLNLTRLHDLEIETASLQLKVRKTGKKSLIDELKAKLAELRGLRKLGLLDDLPGVEDKATREAEVEVSRILGPRRLSRTSSLQDALREAKELGILPNAVIDL